MYEFYQCSKCLTTGKNRAFDIIYLANLIKNTFSRLNDGGNSGLANFPAEISRYILNIASKGKIFSVVAEYVKYFFESTGDRYQQLQLQQVARK